MKSLPCYCCSVAKLCLTVCNSVDYSTSGFRVLHYLLKFAQIHVHWVGDDNHSSSAALFSFYFQSCPASRYLPMSWLFTSGHQNIGASTSLSFQWIFRVDSLWDWLVGSPCCPRNSQESSPAPQFESINSLALYLLYLLSKSHIHTWLLEKP